MPTLQDVANEIKDDLDQIKASTALTAGRVETLTEHLDADETNLAAGIFALWEVNKQIAVLLQDNVQQNTTIICWLKTQADLQCRMLHRLDTIVALDTQTRDSVSKLERVLELVYAREALDVQRLDATDARLAECCPPDVPEPEPCYEPCDDPKPKTYRPKGQDWHATGGVE
jgi:hypothetical protein